MKPTIRNGSYIIVLNNKYLGLDYNEDDIVVIEREVEDKYYVKRIYSIEHDEIYISEDGISNGLYSLPHDPIYYSGITNEVSCKSYSKLLYRNTHSLIDDSTDFSSDSLICTIKIPGDYLFVVGDNHYGSIDSRFWGLIHRDKLTGKVVAIF